MRVQEVLEVVSKFDPVVVGDKTFEPQTTNRVILESGETVFWVHGVDGSWLSLDQESEEIIYFTDIEEEVGAAKEVVLYAGDEFEFSYESSAKVCNDDGEEELVSFREYETSSGSILRMINYEVIGERVVSLGIKVTEDMIQEL